MQGLQNPHDVAVDVMGHAVYVGEVTPTAVWKFQRQTHSTTTASVTTTSTASTTRLAGEDPVPQHEGISFAQAAIPWMQFFSNW